MNKEQKALSVLSVGCVIMSLGLYFFGHAQAYGLAATLIGLAIIAIMAIGFLGDE